MDRPNIPGLTDARWRVYRIFLEAEGPLTLASVASQLHLTVPTVHEHVQWLCDEGKVLEHTGCREYCGRYQVRT